MTTENVLNEIKTALSDLSQDEFAGGARRLLDTLGYRSDRTLDLPGPVNDFIEGFPASNPGTQTERRFLDRATSARVLFQFTDSEIAETQPSLLDHGDFNKGNESSFMFIAVELRDKCYPRGDYVELTREINKRLVVPAVVLFRTANGRLTLAFVHRRPHKRDRTRSVLGSVSLIREIDTACPHRAHLDILGKLALPERLRWMNAHHKPSNFDGLLAAWLDALDTEELNRNFYKQLFTWFERAVEVAKFPTKQARILEPEEHVIRLITRLLFVWFIKEKGLIAPALFIEEQIGPLLREYDRDTGDSYYRAVLQNLFFATLNSEIEGRSFSTKTQPKHRDFARYRFKEDIADPGKLLQLFAQTPFINGGLFDCLDSFESTRDGGYRIDCFTDNVTDPKRKEYGILSIPNRLFFDNEGLISLFDRFQFTVEENTPTEQEVALDPELLGKVFENLLAAYNPETRETVRKQTGSYYTPRAVVDYMVDEVLVAALTQKCPPAEGDADRWSERLRDLLDYEYAFDDAHELFEEVEKEGLVRAIAEIKLIDPAVGSGAFPMGALHKLTLALRRLDPDNRRWKDLQKELAGQRAAAAFDTRNQAERDDELAEISDTFEKHSDSDFGRKLYLIQNSIYGVDIQTIATQIAKLRFFISLTIEQKRDPMADNYGIKPLPNLETRFVAANTLIGLQDNKMLTSEKAQDIEHKLMENRERYFHATTRRHKLACKERDKALRGELAEELEKIGMPADDAEKIAFWDPFDQNSRAMWFDAKYMFGVAEGFDIVIANPPYGISIRDGRSKKIGNADSYANFMILASEISPNGVMAYITPTSWQTAIKFKKFRQNLFSKISLDVIVNLPYDVFSAAFIDTAVTIGRFLVKQAPTFQIATLDKRADLDLSAIDDYLTPADWTTIEQDPSLRIPLIEWATDLYKRILEYATPMGELTESRIGILASKFDIRERNFIGAVPFFTGQVDRYKISSSSQTAFVAMTSDSTWIHDGPRLLTRRIVSRSNRLMSARMMERYVVKKDLYAIKLLDYSDARLATLLSILNSKLISFLLLSRSATATKDDFRQVTLTELRELPIILPKSSRLERDLSQLVQTREQRENNAEDVEHQIDELVYETYGVARNEKKAIDAWLNQSG